MKNHGLVSKGTLSRLRQTAREAFERRDLQECIDLLKQANRLAPSDVGILLQLGRMQGLLYDYSAAEETFDRAVRVAPANRKAEALASAGQQARDFYNTEIAERYFQRAAADKGATPEVLVKMAEFCERRRKMEAAAALVERALSLDGNSAAGLLARGRLDHRAGRLEEAETTLRRLTRLSVQPESRVRAGYELGAVLDRQGHYDEAMKTFLGAKSLLLAEGAPHLAQLRKVRNHLRALHQAVTRDILRNWASAGFPPTRRLALLGGHPRSGTTLLEQVLDSHHDIVSAEETTTFNDEVYRPLQKRHPLGAPVIEILESASTDLILQSRTSYFRTMDLCLGEAIGNRLLVDKNPSLTLMVPAVIRTFPELRLLIALRDPRDVVLSCFMQPFFPIQQVSSSYLRLETAAEEYAALMGMWRTIAPILESPWLEVRYEDMVEDLESVARTALAFLGAPWDSRVLGFDEHAQTKLVRSPTYADVTQKVFTRARGRWRNYQRYLEPHLHKLEPFVKSFGYE